MKTKLLAHAHAEQEVLYRRLRQAKARRPAASPMRAPTSIRSSKSSCRNCPPRATKRAKWAAELKVLRELVQHHVEKRKAQGSVARATISGRTNSKRWPGSSRPEKHSWQRGSYKSPLAAKRSRQRARGCYPLSGLKPAGPAVENNQRAGRSAWRDRSLH